MRPGAGGCKGGPVGDRRDPPLGVPIGEVAGVAAGSCPDEAPATGSL